MDNTELKEVLVGHLLDAMKYASEENEMFEQVGINIQSFGTLENKMWDSIKYIVGMPKKEELGVFISDLWHSYAYDYITGRMSKEDTINYIVNWNRKSETKFYN